MRQPLMASITTAIALSQCIARSQAGWIGRVSSLIEIFSHQNSGTRAVLRAQGLQHAAAALVLDKCDNVQLSAVPVGRQRNVTLHRSEEHTSELQSLRHLVCRLLLEKKKTNT